MPNSSICYAAKKDLHFWLDNAGAIFLNLSFQAMLWTSGYPKYKKEPQHDKTFTVNMKKTMGP